MRVLFDLILFCAVLFAPFWLILVVSAVGILMIPRWYEVVFAYALYELMFRGALSDLAPLYLFIPLSAYAFIAVIVNEWIRGRIRERTI